MIHSKEAVLTIIGAAVISFILLLVACETLKFEGASVTVDFGVNETAYIYENKETGELLYCSNKHDGNPRDFEYKGTAEVSATEIKLCELE